MTAPGSAGPRNSIFPSIDVRLEQAEQEHLRGGRPVNAAVCRDARAALASLRAQNERLREALKDCWGEAYNGGLEGNDPIASFRWIIDEARRALASTDTGETP